MDVLMKQAPVGLSIEEIEKVYNKNDKDVVKTLSELWELEEQVEIIDEDTEKWNKIRDTCDSYDLEMQKIIYKQK